ncbi:MAG: DUF1592 domain-containing protein, partial [Myxococcota bacterium]
GSGMSNGSSNNGGTGSGGDSNSTTPGATGGGGTTGVATGGGGTTGGGDMDAGMATDTGGMMGSDTDPVGMDTSRPPGNEPGPFEPFDPVVRRLTLDEYRYTINDIFGIQLTGSDLEDYPDEQPLGGFVRTARGQTVLPEHVRAYWNLAERIVEDNNALNTFIQAHSDCTNINNADCGQSFIEQASLTLFRHPPTDRERQVLTDLFTTVAEVEVGFTETAQAVTMAMLQMPSFLYLIEIEQAEGTRRDIGGYEMASRLSYTLWGSPPDSTLYEAAANGRLDTPEGIAAEVDRMLTENDKLARVVGRFVRDWGRLDSLPDDDGLKGELIEIAVAHYSAHMLRGASVFELLTDQHATLTPALAEAYGIEDVQPDIHTYDTSGLPGRVGLLTQPGIVAGMTNADGGAIVARGLFLQAQLLCGDVFEPPDSLADAIDSFVDELPEDATDRDIAEERLTRGECAGCHAQFDPLAYGFESFNYRGAWIEQDSQGRDVRVDGWIPANWSDTDERQFYDNMEDYMEMLSANSTVRRCLIQRQIEYATGQLIETGQQRAVYDLVDALMMGDGSYEELLRELVVHQVFRTMATANP